MKIGDFVYSKLGEGLDDMTILDLVKKKFPDAKTTRGCISWYKAKAKKAAREGTEITETDDEVIEALGTTFGLESDLQRALRSNIEQLELGLKITDGGREKIVPSGKIDISAEDRAGNTVVIELKAGTAARDAIGQILSYIGDFSSTGVQCRGIVVAADFSPAAVSAAVAVPNILLVKYGFKFSFEMIRQRV
jgi:hypothetical protein